MKIIVSGKQGEGKTSFVNSILKNRFAFFIDENDIGDEFLMNCISKTNAEFLVIDEVNNLEKVNKFLEKKAKSVRFPYTKDPVKVELPKNIILITQLPI